MVRKNSNIDFPKLMPKGMIIGLSASISTTILGSCIGAWLLHSERIAEENLGYITLLILLLSSVTGGLLTIQTVKTKRLLSCLVFGGIYLLSLLALTALFWGGSYSGVGESALVVFSGVLSVALIGAKGKTTTRKRRRK